MFNRWSDLRLLGHEYNWAVPGATARTLRNLITNQNLKEITSDASVATLLLFAPEWRETPARLASQLSSTSAAVIWCGGDDLRFGNTDPSCTINGITSPDGTHSTTVLATASAFRLLKIQSTP